MRIVLNIKRLLEQKLITPAEAGRLKSFSSMATFQFAVSILIVFGILALAGGVFALEPSTEIITLIGVVLMGFGMLINKVKSEYSFALVSFVTLVSGALLTAGGIATEFENVQIAALICALLFIVVSVVANSGFLAAMSAVTLAAVFGGAAGYGIYGSGSYMIGLESRSFAIIVFLVLGTLAYQSAKRLKSSGERIALIFSRMSLIIVNVAFWLGSLFGDTIGKIDYEKADFNYDALYAAYDASMPTWVDKVLVLPSGFLAVIWAVAIVLTGIWAVRANSSFSLNTVTVFAAIHFYTQWFERFGAESWSLLTAGGIAVLIGFGLSFVNNEKGKKVAAVGAAMKTVETVATPSVKKTVAKKQPAKKAVVKKVTVKKAAPKKKAKK